jgi:LemA protein
MSGTVITWIIIGVIVLLVLWIIMIYNGLVAMRQRVNQAFSDIDVQTKQRHDLIPNLVETVKGYAAHERETFQAVTDARARAMQASGPAASGAAEGMLSQALGRLFAVAEAYPELKANENMLALQEELTSTENRVAFARQAYNDSVMEYNTKRESIPANLIAGMFGFTPAELLPATESAEERKAPRVSFS